MKIVHCISSIDETTGGPARSVTHLVDELVRIETISEVTLVTLNSENPLISKSMNPKIKLKFNKPGFLGYSKELKEAMNGTDADLFHGHGLWQLPVCQMAAVAKKRNIPYVISIRGMLEPWSMQQSVFKKKIAMALFQHTDLKKASCLHATALMEVQSIRALGYKNPIACIPNGINIHEFPQKIYTTERDRKKRALFLSRIHPKKGIELLISAWKTISVELRGNWVIDIVGNGEREYIDELTALIKSKQLEGHINILGPKFGAEKLKVYHSADLFVLPTYSENFGIVIAEALSCGIPVITTKGAPWEEIELTNSGRWIDTNEEALSLALKEMLAKTDTELHEMGTNGRKLIEEHYSIVSVAKKIADLYTWVLLKGEKPNFIYL